MSKYNNLKDELIQVVKAHPVLVIFNLPVAIGGLILIIYLLHIEFFPIVSSGDIILLLLLSFIVGMGLFLFISFVMIFPVNQYQKCKGLSDLEYKLENKCIEDKRNFNNKNQINNKTIRIVRIFNFLFSNKCYEENKQQGCNPQMILLFTPLMANLAIIIGLFYLYTIPFFYGYKLILLIIGLIAITTLAIYIFYVQLKILDSSIKLSYLLKNELLITYLKSIYIGTFLIFIAFYILMSLLTNSDALKNNQLLLLGYTFVFILTCTISGVMEKKIWKQLLSIMIILGILSFFTKVHHVIPSAIMKMLTIGQVKMEKIVLTKEGCQIFGIDTQKEFCERKDILLLWRIGEVYLFSETVKVDSATIVKRYYIPKTSILSMEQMNLTKDKYSKKNLENKE